MSFTLWFTGLSGAGKSTLSWNVYLEIRRRGLKAELLDGDLIRSNFSQELTFSRRDRDINVRRIGFVSHLLNKNDVVSVVAAIAPYANTREQNRQLLDNYLEVFVNCPLEVVEKRDVKGLYRRARKGEIENFTGISDPYEAPQNAEVVVFTSTESVPESVAKVVDLLEERGFIPRPDGCEIVNFSEEDEKSWRERLVDLGYCKTGKST